MLLSFEDVDIAAEAETGTDTVEAITQGMAERVKGQPEKMGLRKRLVEHPFGGIKRVINQAYFLMKGKEKV